jgi:hypothetical protein
VTGRQEDNRITAAWCGLLVLAGLVIACGAVTVVLGEALSGAVLVLVGVVQFFIFAFKLLWWVDHLRWYRSEMKRLGGPRDA